MARTKTRGCSGNEGILEGKRDRNVKCVRYICIYLYYPEDIIFFEKWAASDVGQQETSRMYLSSYSKAYDAKVIISDECALRFDTELRQTWDNGRKYRWLQEIPYHVLCQVRRSRTSNERYSLNPKRNCRVHIDESFGLDYLRSFGKCLIFIQLQG